MQTEERAFAPMNGGANGRMPARASDSTEASVPLSVLIIDDEKMVRNACRAAAITLGYHVSLAENAGNAYKTLESHSVDVVMLDMRLPGSSSGLEMLKEIRSRYPHVVVLVMTGYATISGAVDAIQNGAYDYLTKPLDLQELRLKLQALRKQCT